jgi:inhibitor of KinA sporulation pathway (predicted exonuclease)
VTVKRDAVVVVDIEATCWKHEPPPGQINEIIEIGVTCLHVGTLTVSEPVGILVKPERSTVSPFCTELTTLTQGDVDEGVTFAAACEVLVESYETPQRLWASWGDYDRRMFVQQAQTFGVPYPFSPQYVNLKALYAKVNQLRRQVGMARALKMSNLPQLGTHHRGIDDAYNIARLLEVMLCEHGSDILDPFWS